MKSILPNSGSRPVNRRSSIWIVIPARTSFRFSKTASDGEPNAGFRSRRDVFMTSAYNVMKQQSVAYGLNGEIEDATYVPQSVGRIEVPPGPGMQSGTSDIYNEAIRRNNAGGADGLRDPQWNR